MTNADLSIELNYKQYTPDHWHCHNDTFSKEQQDTMRNTVRFIQQDAIKNGITARFNGKQLTFHCLSDNELDVTLKFKHLASSDGEHNTKKHTITLNTELCNNGPLACGTVHHEMTHVIQAALVAHKDEYSRDSDEYKYLCLLEQEVNHHKVQINSFGISINGQIYVHPDGAYASLLQHEFAEIMYHLQLTERHAFAAGYTARNIVIDYIDNEEIKKIERAAFQDYEDKSLRNFKNMYDAHNLTTDQVFTLIDNAKLNLINQVSPAKYQDLEALVTLDIAECLQIQNSNIFVFKHHVNEFKRRQDAQVRDVYLKTYYEFDQKSFFDPKKSNRIGDVVFLNNSPFCDSLSSIDDIKTMTELEQIQNPLAIVRAVCILGAEVLKDVQNEDMFHMWCASDFNTLSELTMMRLEEELGPKYSKENLAIANEHIKQFLYIQNLPYSNLDNQNIGYADFDYGIIR